MEKIMLLITAISAWGMLIFAPTASITWDLKGFDANKYSTFITGLRNSVKDPKLVYFNIPMLPKPVTPPTYILVGLKSSAGNTIILALNKNNLYVVAYSDTYKGKARAYFFPDAPTNAKDALFPEAKTAKQVYNINYDSRYPTIEGKAGTRKQVGLGIQKLDNRIDKVFGAETNDKIQAEFLLIAIQTVAEATRFKYIETQIRNNNKNFEFTPDDKVINLENEWGKISGAVRKANPDGTFKSPIDLIDAKGKKYQAKKVDDVKGDIALLNYVA